MKKVLAILMAVVLVVGIFAGCGGKNEKAVNKTYTEAVELTVKLLSGQPLSRADTSKMQTEAFFTYEASLDEYYAAVQQQCKINENTMVAVFGKNYKVSYEIVKDEKMDAEERFEATQHLVSESWYDAKELNEVRELDMVVSFTGENLSKSFDMEIQLMQLGSGWYVLGIECDEMYDFFNWE